MKELSNKDELTKIYPLINQLRKDLSLNEFLDKFYLAVKTQNYKLFALEKDDCFIAACGVMPFNVIYHTNCLYICDFVVDEKERSQGIGQDFLNKIFSWAKKQGYEEIELSSSFFRQKAHIFYTEKMSFIKTGFVFKKKLNSNT